MEGSPTLQRLPGERNGNRAKVLGLLCANRHTEAGMLVCEHMHHHQPLPYSTAHADAGAQRESQVHASG